MKLVTFAAGAAVGYVLGAKAGQERYQQIVAGARNFGQNPTVQQAQTKIKELAGQGTATVVDKLTPDDDTTTTSLGSDPVVTRAPAPKKTTASTPTFPDTTV